MRWHIFCFVFLLGSPLLSATVLFTGEYDETYNLDDPLEVAFSLERQNILSDYVEVFLVCDSEDHLVYKSFVRLDAGEPEEISFSFPLTLSGEVCSLLVSFSGEEEESPSFEISRDIVLEVYVSDRYLLPGESVFVNGTARLVNGGDAEGIVSLRLGSFFSQSFEVTEGTFSATIPLGAHISPGNYSLEVVVEERDFSEQVTNVGRTTLSLRALSAPTTLFIDAPESVSPAEGLSYSVTLLDQRNQSFSNESILVRLVDPSFSEVYEGLAVSGQSHSYDLPPSAEKGAWQIYALYGSLSSKTPVFVLASPLVSTTLESNTSPPVLVVTNEGNAPYQGVINATFFDGESSHIEYYTVNLSVGGVQRIPLSDVSGTQNVSVGGETYPGVVFTGYSVSLPSSSRGISWVVSGLFLFLFLVGAFFFFRRQNSRKKTAESHSPLVKTSENREIVSDAASFVVFIRSSLSFSLLHTLAASYDLSLSKATPELSFVFISSQNPSKTAKHLRSFADKILAQANHSSATCTVGLHAGKKVTKASEIQELASQARALTLRAHQAVVGSDHFSRYLV